MSVAQLKEGKHIQYVGFIFHTFVENIIDVREKFGVVLGFKNALKIG